MKTNLLKRQDGFTLVEIMVAVGLLGGLAVAGMSLFQNQSEAQKTVERNYEVTTIVNEIRGLLSNPTFCTETFLGVNPSNGTITSIKKLVAGVSTPVYPVNVMLPGAVMIKSYQLKNSFSNLASDETVLQITFARGKGTIKDQYMKQIKLVYTLSGGNIATCYAAASTTDSLWEISTTNPNDIFYSSGEVGIGVANPVAPLHVFGSAPSGETLRLSNSVASEGGQLTLMDNSGAGGWEIDNNGTGPTAKLRFFRDKGVNNAVGMTLTPDGFLGVGTSSPGVLLDLWGSAGGLARLQSSGNNAAVIVYHTSDGGTHWWQAGAYGAGTAGVTAGSYGINDNGNMRMLIDPNGNVGIGTTSPGQKLHVQSSAGTYIQLDTTSGSHKRAAVGFSSNGSGQFEMGNDLNANGGRNFYIYDNQVNAARFFIENNGNVGIGTTSPSVPLDVPGVSRINEVLFNQGWNPSFTFKGRSFVGRQTLVTNGTSGAWAMSFDSSTNRTAMVADGPIVSWEDGAYFAGEVGIGTLSPANSLSIAGSGNCIELGAGVAKESSAGQICYQRHQGDALTIVGAGTSGTNRKVTVWSEGGMIVYGSLSAGAFYYNSDRRLKKEIAPLKDALTRVVNLDGREFVWNNTNQRDIGFVAQEVEKREPTLVKTDSKGYKSVAYGNIVALVVEAIKDLASQVRELFSEQDEINQKLEAVMAENRVLKARLDTLEAKQASEGKEK